MTFEQMKFESLLGKTAYEAYFQSGRVNQTMDNYFNSKSRCDDEDLLEAFYDYNFDAIVIASNDELWISCDGVVNKILLDDPSTIASKHNVLWFIKNFRSSDISERFDERKIEIQNLSKMANLANHIFNLTSN